MVGIANTRISSVCQHVGIWVSFFNDKMNRLEAKGTIQLVDSLPSEREALSLIFLTSLTGLVTTAPGEGTLRRSRSSSARLPCEESLEYNRLHMTVYVYNHGVGEVGRDEGGEQWRRATRTMLRGQDLLGWWISKFWYKNRTSAHYDIFLRFLTRVLFLTAHRLDGGETCGMGHWRGKAQLPPQHLEVRGSSRSDRRTVERVKLQSGEGCTNSPQYKLCIYKYLMRIFSKYLPNI